MLERPFARAAFTFVALSACLLTGCPPAEPPKPPPAPTPAADRDSDAAAPDPLGETTSRVEYLDQNWTAPESTRFYFTSQGSQIVPYDWFLALEQPDNERLFRENAHMIKYRYLVQKPGAMNPDGLPVGFVKDEGRERAWMGFTCAACHTGQIDYEGVGYRIDGGPALADVHGFLTDLSAALVATRDDAGKFDRFAQRVLKHAASPGDRDQLKNDLTLVIDRRQGYLDRNFPADTLPGHGRVDAFGAIMNEVFHRAIADGSPTANTAPANAPVSYPFLWDTPQHDKVQWNGVAENKGLGALGRNVGEVLGVFGDFDIPAHPPQTGYASSLQIRNLLALEEWLKSLWSPTWPAGFPKIDEAKRARGREIYLREGCADCHAVIDRADPGRKITAIMRAVGTDARMSDNFSQRVGQTGKLEGAFLSVFRWPPIDPPRFGASATAEEVLSHTVKGVILGGWKDAPQDELSQVEYQSRKVVRAVAIDKPLGGTYKGRPLNGIWATAPYLHNGSIASLYQLLLPPRERLASFSIGTRQFDPVNVGYRVAVPGFPKYEARDAQGKAIPGNSNEGHEYGTALPDDQRWDLVEYLKSL